MVLGLLVSNGSKLFLELLELGTSMRESRRFCQWRSRSKVMTFLALLSHPLFFSFFYLFFKKKYEIVINLFYSLCQYF